MAHTHTHTPPEVLPSYEKVSIMGTEAILPVWVVSATIVGHAVTNRHWEGGFKELKACRDTSPPKEG